MVEPEPLRKPPSAPAFSAAEITPIEERHELRPVRLMQMIDHSAAKLLIIRAGQSGGDGAGICRTIPPPAADRSRPGEARRASFVCTSKSGTSKTN